MRIQTKIFFINNPTYIDSQCTCDDVAIQKATTEEKIITDQRHDKKRKRYKNNWNRELLQDQKIQ